MEFANNRYVAELVFQREPEKDLYLKELPVVSYLRDKKKLHFASPVTIFVGENGTGKSTLIEAIAVCAGFNPEGGSRNFIFSTNNTHSELCECISLARYNHPRDGYFLRAESFYNVATNIDEMDEAPSFDPPVIESYGGISLHRQSHGESFMNLVENRFFGNGLYILDEPEAALSPMKIMSLMVSINELVKKNSQFIISTHSPILMALPGAYIYQLSSGGIEHINYKDTEHYQITKRFLENPDKMLSYLLGD
jgi:predicted ATPase